MKFASHWLWASVAATLAGLAGCAGVPTAPQFDRVAVDSHSLRGELALEAQDTERAAREFLAAARLSREPALVERATQIAYAAGMQDIGLDAARLWVDVAPDDARADWFAGVFELRAGRSDAAEGYFRDVAATAAEQGDVGAGLALVTEALIAEPDTAPGVAIMRGLVAAHPDSAQGHFGLARLAFRAGDVPLAVDHARRAANLEPDWLDAQMLHARTLLLAGRTDEALALMGQLAQVSDNVEVRLQHAELLLSAGRMDEARDRLEGLLEEHPGLIDATRALAFLAMAQEDLDEAQGLFEALRYDLAYRDEAFYYLGRIAESNEQLLPAMRAYQRVTDGTHAVEAQLRTAGILMGPMRDPEGALRHLAEFGAGNPRFESDMLVARARLLVAMGRADDAMALFDSRLAEGTDDPALQDAHAELYVLLANEASDRGALDEAGSLLETGIGLYPDHVSLVYAQSLLLQEQGELRKAVRLLESLVDDHPDNPVLLNALGYLLADRLDRPQQARGHIQKALAMDPDNAAIIDSMGWVLFKLGDYGTAHDYLDRAFRLEPHPEIAAHLIEARWALGERQQALQLLDALLEANPGSPPLVDVERRLRP